MTVLLQVSDAHFGTERPGVVRGLLTLAAEQRPDVMVLSGDITQRARRRQFDEARRFVDAIGPRQLLAIPGNHDIPLFDVLTRLLHPYRNFRRAFGEDLEPVLDLPDVLIVGVNTTRPRRHKHGEVSRLQVAQVAERLQLARVEQLRLVVVHQPVHAPTPKDVVNVLRGAEEAIPEWSRAGADLVLGGHVHLPFVRSLKAANPGLARDMWTVQAGTAVSCRVRGGVPNSVNVVRCLAGTSANRRCAVERWDYSEATARFGLVELHELSFACAAS